jgi:hypothetical protein
MSENDFECFASTGVNTPEAIFPNFRLRFPETSVWSRAENPVHNFDLPVTPEPSQAVSQTPP